MGVGAFVEESLKTQGDAVGFVKGSGRLWAWGIRSNESGDCGCAAGVFVEGVVFLVLAPNCSHAYTLHVQLPPSKPFSIRQRL